MKFAASVLQRFFSLGYCFFSSLVFDLILLLLGQRLKFGIRWILFGILCLKLFLGFLFALFFNFAHFSANPALDPAGFAHGTLKRISVFRRDLIKLELLVL